jgi:hypothetical protein
MKGRVKDGTVTNHGLTKNREEQEQKGEAEGTIIQIEYHPDLQKPVGEKVERQSSGGEGRER